MANRLVRWGIVRHSGRLAQLARALPSHGRGPQFESGIAHQEIAPPNGFGPLRTAGGSAIWLLDTRIAAAAILRGRQVAGAVGVRQLEWTGEAPTGPTGRG